MASYVGRSTLGAPRERAELIAEVWSDGRPSGGYYFAPTVSASRNVLAALSA